MKRGLLILFMFISPVIARADDINLSHLTVKDGLLNSTVYYAMQDSKGFIWFCTETGVSRYDGQKFTDYTMNDGLADNVIFKCYEDKRHRIWFLSYNGKISYYLDGKIYNSENTSSLSYPLTGAYLMQCIEDKWGNLWFSTSLADVIRINDNGVTTYRSMYPERNKSDYYLPYVFFKENDSVKKFALDPETLDIYLQNFTGWKKQAAGKFPAVYEQQARTTGKQFCNAQSALFINGKDLVAYNGNGQWRAFDPKPYGITSNIVFFLQEGRFLWLSAYGQGVYKIDMETGVLCLHLLQNELVTSILKDSEKNMWFVTHDNGIFVLKNNPQLFTTINTGTTFSARSIPCHGQSYLLCGNNNGLLHIAEQGQIKKTIRFTNRQFDRVLDIIPNGDGEVLAGLDGGLYGYNILSGKKTDYSQFLLGYKNYNVAPDKSIWMCSPNKIIQVKGHHINVIANQLPEVKYTAIAVTGNGAYYAGTINKLYKVTESPGHVQVVLDDSTLKTQVTGLAIVNGQLWVATHGNGIFIVSNDKVTQHITKANSGIISDICQKLYDDGSKYIWLATNEGISAIGRNDLKLASNINSDAGIASNDIKNITTDKERIYAATSAGTSVFKLSEVQFKSRPPRVYITGFKKDNGATTEPGPSIEFSYFKGFITVSFTAIAFQQAQDLQYEYKFAEATEWRMTPVTDIPFFSLSPGTHILMFRAKKYNSEWSRPVSLAIIVDPLWYQSIWFKASCVLMVLLTAYFLVYLRLKAVKRKAREEQEYNKKINELENKALISQMNPHFIFNSLNTVQQLILVKEEQQSLDYLSDFSMLMRQMLENSRKQQITLSEEADFLRRYLQLEEVRFNNKFEYTIEIDKDLAPDEIKIPPALLQPLLENAIKHGISSLAANGWVNLCVFKEDEFLVAVVEDNGIGISAHKLAKTTLARSGSSTALKVLEERLKLMRNNKGGVSTMKITDKQNGTGTIVELRLIIEV